MTSTKDTRVLTCLGEWVLDIWVMEGSCFKTLTKGPKMTSQSMIFCTIFAHFFVVFYNSFWLQTEVPATMLNPKALGKAFDYMEVLK